MTQSIYESVELRAVFSSTERRRRHEQIGDLSLASDPLSGLFSRRSFFPSVFVPFLPSFLLSFFLLRPRLSAPSHFSPVLSPPRLPPPFFFFFSSFFFSFFFLVFSLSFFEDFRISRSSFVILFAEVNCTVRSIVWRVLVRRHRWAGRGFCGSVGLAACVPVACVPIPPTPPPARYPRLLWSLLLVSVDVTQHEKMNEKKKKKRKPCR